MLEVLQKLSVVASLLQQLADANRRQIAVELKEDGCGRFQSEHSDAAVARGSCLQRLSARLYA